LRRDARLHALVVGVAHGGLQLLLPRVDLLELLLQHEVGADPAGHRVQLVARRVILLLQLLHYLPQPHRHLVPVHPRE